MTRKETYHHASVTDDEWDCALVISGRTGYDDDDTEVQIRIRPEDIPRFMAQVASHAGYALSVAARRIEVGHCETCANIGLVKTTKNGRPWSVDCPDCRHRWPDRPFGSAPRIGYREG